MYEFHPKRRFRQRDLLLPNGPALEWAHTDFAFAEAMLALVRAEPWITVRRLIDESELMDIQERAKAVLESQNVPRCEWGSTPVDKHSAWYYDNDCQGK